MAGNKDFINILQEIRGTGAPGDIPTDGIWYELMTADTNGNPGVYGDILAKYGVIASNELAIQTIQEISDEIQRVAAIDAQVVAVSANEANVTTVATNIGNVNIVAPNIANVNTTATNIVNVNTVASSDASVNTTAANIDKVDTVALNINNVITAAGDTLAINDITSEPLRSSVLSAGTNATNASNSAAAASSSETNASTSETNAQLSAWEAEAERMTADSYATEPEDVFVKVYTSNGNGTFTATPTTEYSSYHWNAKSMESIGGTAMTKEIYDTDFSGIVDSSEKLTNFNKHGIVLGGMDVTVDGVDLDLLNISAGTYYIDGVERQYAGGSFDTSALLAGEFGTLGINSAGSLVLKSNTFFTEVELETILELTAFAKFTNTTVDAVAVSKFHTDHFVRDMLIRAKAFEGTYFNKTAGLITESITPLQLDIAQGYINTPNAETKLITAASNIGGATIYNVAGTYKIIGQSPLVVSDTQYDNGTNLVAIPNQKWVTHTVARSSRTGTVYLISGKTVYNSEGDAINAPYDLGSFADNEPTSEIEPLANIVVKDSSGIQAIVDLRNKSSNVVSTVLNNLTLQTAYDLSGVPEIQLLAGKTFEIRNDVGDTNTVLQKWTDAVGNTIAEVTKTGIPKSNVGLDQVDNTSDVNKPVSTAQETRIQQAEASALAFSIALG